MNINPMTNPKTARLALKASKNAPHLAVGFGVAAIIGGAVWACRSTLKLEAVMHDNKDKFALIKAGREEYSEEDYSKKDFYEDMVKQYIRAGADFVKLYGPPIALGIAGIASIIWGHRKVTLRMNGAMAAYAVLQDRFNAYRNRVREDYGTETEEDIYHMRRSEKRMVKEKDAEGNVQKREEVSKSFPDIGVIGGSEYLQLFSTENRLSNHNYWDDIYMLQRIQSEMNTLLECRGHVFLNEVYTKLGLPHTTQGSVVGWVMKPDAPNYIDFGVWDGEVSQMVRDQEGFTYNGIWMDFNVDGIIYDLI